MFGLRKKKDVFDALYGKDAPRSAPMQDRSNVTAVSQLSPWRYGYNDGSKFAGGYGVTQVLTEDYWTLRIRSSELFETNHYARGLIRRLIDNEINVGLHLEATPEEALLGYAEDELADWSETTENRFALWAADPYLCDHNERLTFGEIQAAARMEALISGDVLVVMRTNPLTGLPRIQLVSGALVRTPMDYPKRGNKIKHGVDLDSSGRHVAFWVTQEDGASKRLPAYGEKSGRKLAWLVYGNEIRLDDVRGKPWLSHILQSLKEIDRYRDSTQRKALVLSMLAMFVSKEHDKPGSRPMGGGAIRRGTETTTDATGVERRFRTDEQIPGMVIDELQQGETPHAFQTNGTVESFGTFEDSIISSIAWTGGIPPEIATLSFNSNYSASQAAINEFKLKLNVVRTVFGNNFCQPIYKEWLLADVQAGRIEAPGLLEAWRDPKRFDEYGAWMSADWSGHIKPAVDMSKLVGGYETLVAHAWITNDRASRELTGTKFSKNVQKIARENELLAAANKPLAPPEPKVAAPAKERSIDDEPIDDEDADDDVKEDVKDDAAALAN